MSCVISVDRMWNNRDINIFVSIFGPWEELARVAISVGCMIRRMKSKVFFLFEVG